MLAGGEVLLARGRWLARVWEQLPTTLMEQGEKGEQGSREAGNSGSPLGIGENSGVPSQEDLKNSGSLCQGIRGNSGVPSGDKGNSEGSLWG